MSHLPRVVGNPRYSRVLDESQAEGLAASEKRRSWYALPQKPVPAPKPQVVYLPQPPSPKPVPLPQPEAPTPQANRHFLGVDWKGVFGLRKPPKVPAMD